MNRIGQFKPISSCRKFMSLWEVASGKCPRKRKEKTCTFKLFGVDALQRLVMAFELFHSLTPLLFERPLDVDHEKRIAGHEQDVDDYKYDEKNLVSQSFVHFFNELFNGPWSSCTIAKILAKFCCRRCKIPEN